MEKTPSINLAPLAADVILEKHNDERIVEAIQREVSGLKLAQAAIEEAVAAFDAESSKNSVSTSE